MPSGDKERDAKLPGMGGIYNPFNLATYTYTYQNPVRLTDPDGNATQAERDTALKLGNYEVLKETLTKNYQKTSSDLPVDNSYWYGKKGKNGPYTDCSGYASKLMPGLNGNAHMQLDQTSKVDVEDIMPGDLIFLKTGSDPTKNADHVGLIAGVTRNEDGKVSGYDVIHASSGRGKNKESIKIGGSDSRSMLFNNHLVGFGTLNKETDPVRPNASWLDKAIDYVKQKINDN